MNAIRVLYEDNHLLAVEKPANIPVQQDISGDEALLSLLKQYIREKYGKPGNVFIGLVHRLDRPVGGAIVFARTSKAASRLSEQIRSRSMRKTYLAVSEGSFSSQEGTYRDYLRKDRNTNTVRVVPAGTGESQEAVLHYRVIRERDGKVLVKIHLETGRPHQIRVQFSHHGHPLSGDGKYGSAGQRGLTDQLALWSCELVFRHPVRNEIIRITSAPPVHSPWDLFIKDMEGLF